MLKDLLTGRLALVTGGGRGNGAAIARGLADAGAKVIVTDIDIDAAHALAEGIVKAGGEARGYALDVTDHEGCRKLAEDIESLLKPGTGRPVDKLTKVEHDIDNIYRAIEKASASQPEAGESSTEPAVTNAEGRR